MSIFIKSGTDYYGEYESSNPNANNIIINENGLTAKTLLNNFQMNGTGFTSGASTSTWADTHTTVINTKALRTIVNPQVLAVDNTLLVLDDVTTATCAVNIQADNTGNVGTHFGIDITNTANNNDFEIRNDPDYEGSIVFKDFGAGAGTTQTGIKQGTISLTDTATPLVTSFTPTTLTSDGVSATWADIISGSAGNNTLEEVLTAGNTATEKNLIITSNGTGVPTSTNTSGFGYGVTSPTNQLGIQAQEITMSRSAGGSVNIFSAGTAVMVNAGVGGGLNPQLTLTNTNATGSVVQEVYKNKPTPSLNGDVLHSLLVYGKDAGNLKQEFGRIVFTTRDNTSGTEDGSIEFGCQNAGVATTFLQINGIENEINALKNLDLGGNQLRTNTGDMSILSTTSSGTGIMTIASKGALNIGSATDNIITTSNLQMGTDKQITLIDSSPAVVSTQLRDGVITVDDITNLSRATVAPTAFTIQNTSVGQTTTYSLSGFFNSDNSIQCNSNNGFILNNGSTTNKSTLDLQKMEVFNSGVNNQDTILLQNSGSGNPVLNVQTTNTSTNFEERMGASPNGMGVSRTNLLTFTNKQVSINNNPSSPCIIQHFDSIDNQPFIIGTPNSLDLSMGQDFILNGSNIISGSSGGSSGQHLRILLNGTYYKIQLQND